MSKKNRHWYYTFFWLMCHVVLALTLAQGVGAQTVPTTGLRSNTPRVHALINTRIVPQPGKVIGKGTIILRDGVIESVGEKVIPPADARVWDCEGLTIYPGLIEMYSSLGVGDSKPKDIGARHWNASVRSEVDVVDFYKPTSGDLDKLRALGFTAALIVPNSGIFRGESALMSLGNDVSNEQVIKKDIAQHLAFERVRGRVYPGSLMGVIALMRQTFLDAQWYRDAHDAIALKPAGQERPESNGIGFGRGCASFCACR